MSITRHTEEYRRKLFRKHKQKAKRWRDLAIGHDAWPKRVAEVGVCLPQMAETICFIQDPAVEVELFEPQPEAVVLLREAFRNYQNVTIREIAITDTDGMFTMKREHSKYGEHCADGGACIDSPEITWTTPREETFAVVGRRFHHFDDGTFDLVKIDTEGSDWFVIKHMMSRPKLFIFESYIRPMRNPFEREIDEWAAAHGYKEIYEGHGRLGGDKAYLRC